MGGVRRGEALTPQDIRGRGALPGSDRLCPCPDTFLFKMNKALTSESTLHLGLDSLGGVFPYCYTKSSTRDSDLGTKAPQEAHP